MSKLHVSVKYWILNTHNLYISSGLQIDIFNKYFYDCLFIDVFVSKKPVHTEIFVFKPSKMGENDQCVNNR